LNALTRQSEGALVEVCALERANVKVVAPGNATSRVLHKDFVFGPGRGTAAAVVKVGSADEAWAPWGDLAGFGRRSASGHSRGEDGGDGGEEHDDNFAIQLVRVVEL
jgi:hypothetical protein